MFYIDALHKAAKDDNTENLYVLLESLGIMGISDIFEKQKSLTKIVIPSNINEIGSKSFVECTKLKQVLIPSLVTRLGFFAFYKCISIVKITVPSSVIVIDDYAFSDCVNLVKITLSSSLTKIGEKSFSNCSKLKQIKLKQIKIPQSVTFIGSYAFEKCKSIKEISIPPSVTSINIGTFCECLKLEKIFIPSSVNFIGECAFLGCISLKEIKIPNITTIKYDSFSYCESLKEVTIPPSVTKIESSAFSNCRSLTKVSIPSSVKIVENYSFDNCKSLNEFKSNSYEEEMCFIDATFGLCLINIVAFVLILMSSEFIISVVWWSRLHPWFSHGYKSGKVVYQNLEICWISIICIYFILFLCLLVLFLDNAYENRLFYQRNRQFFIKGKRVFFIACLIMSILLYLIHCITAIIASSYALKNDNVDGRSIKCLRYMFDGYQGAYDWSLNKSFKTQNDLYKWHSKMISKAYGKNDKVTNYYCFLVGIPTLLFAVSPIAFLIFITILIFIANS